MSYGLLLLRVFVGFAFVGHGTQKLFGWWGGYGPQGTGGYFSSLGYRSGVQMAVLAGLAEAGGGALLALGLLTPVACTALAVVMINAIAAQARGVSSPRASNAPPPASASPASTAIGTPQR